MQVMQGPCKPREYWPRMNADNTDRRDTQLLICVIRAIRGTFLPSRLTFSTFFRRSNGEFIVTAARQPRVISFYTGLVCVGARRGIFG
jgi:hypothetical protein